MNVQVIWKGTDITSSVISYSRQHKICSGIGSIDLTVEAKTSRSFAPWDEIVIKENGNTQAKYYITGYEKSAPTGAYVISAQDESKRMTDYFIKESYEITYPSTARYWIELFLTECGVTYNITPTDYGASLSENTQLGLKSVYDEVVSLLQLSGWFFYFDSSSICQIGKLELTAGNIDYYFDDTDIIKTSYKKSDKHLRNRAVVWGTGDATTGQWIFADTSTITPWNRDDGDYRTVVYANPHVKTISVAFSLAWTLLNEFTQLIYQKEIELHGIHEVALGERVEVDSNYMHSTGTITTYIVDMGADGLKTTCVMDELCPRLFGYAHWTGYVYTGHKSDGIYRRLLKSTSWQNYSTGITDLSIKDISAYDGLLGAVSSGGYFYRRHTQGASWYAYNPPPLVDVSTGSGVMVVSGVSAVACTINKTGLIGNYAVALTVPVSGGASPTSVYPTSGDLSWVVGMSAGGGTLYTHQIYVPRSGEADDYGVTALDIEALDTGANIISVGQTRNRFLTPIITGDDGYWGYVDSANNVVNYSVGFIPADKNTYSSLPPATSGIWMEYTKYDPDGYRSMSITCQGNPTVTNLVTASGGYIFDWYVWGTPSGFIQRVTQTKSYASGLGDYDSSYQTFYINHPFGTGATDYQNYVDYFYKIDSENYGFFNHKKLFGFNSTYKQVNIYTGAGTTVTYDPPYGGQYYYRFNTDQQKEYNIFYASGNYSIIIYVDEPGKNLSVWRLDMRDGTYGSQAIVFADDITNPPPDPGDYYAVTPVKESSHYIYFGVIHVKKSDKVITVPPFIANMSFHTICMDKYNGTFYTNTITESKTLLAPGGGEILTATFDEENEYITYNVILGGYRGYRGEVFQIVSENQDNGTGWGGFYVPMLWKLAVDTDDDDIADEYPAHNLTYFFYVGTPNGAWTRVDDDDNVTMPGGWFSNTNPAWMHSPSGISTFNIRDIQSAESRYDTQIPFLWRNYTTSKEGASTNAIVEPLNWSNYSNVELISRDTGYTNNLAYAKTRIDDVEEIMYAAVESYYIPASTKYSYFYIVAYDSAGNIIKKIQPAGRAADDYNGYWFTQTAPYSTWREPQFTVVMDMISRHQYRTRGIGAFNDQSFTFSYLLPYVSGLWKRTRQCHILKHDVIPPSGQFTKIYTHSDYLYVDAAKGTPTVIHEYPASGAVISGATQYGGNSHLIGASFLNEWGSFDTEVPLTPIYSARVFDIADPSNFPPLEQGTVSSVLDRYVGLAGGYEGIKIAPTDVQLPYGVLKTFPGSGEVVGVDFTNLEPDPYIVAAIRGASTSGVFFQRNPGTSVFFETTSGLPPSEIMIVRIDDKV